jgi:hypothetical protein
MCRDRKSLRGALGFSLIELIISTALVLAVMGATFRLINQAYSAFYSEPDAPDATQKARVVVDTITHNLLAAGADLARGIPAAAPSRRGVIDADPPESSFDDRVSVVYAPPRAATTVVNGVAEQWNQLLVADQAGCLPGNPLCGFRVDDLAIVGDETGAYDLFRIVRIEPGPPASLLGSASLSKLYGRGAAVTVVLSATFWLDVDQATGSGVVRKYDGDRTDAPLVDNVGGMMFEYFGEAGRIDLARFSDGPWLPDAVSTNRYDADLLGVRRIRATLQLRAPRRLLAPSSFETVRFDVAPRNLNRQGR